MDYVRKFSESKELNSKGRGYEIKQRGLRYQPMAYPKRIGPNNRTFR